MFKKIKKAIRKVYNWFMGNRKAIAKTANKIDWEAYAGRRFTDNCARILMSL